MSNPAWPVTQIVDLADLTDRLHGLLAGRIRNLELSARDHGLVLRGSARTYYAKQLAQQAVANCTGIPLLANEIEVAERPRSDAEER